MTSTRQDIHQPSQDKTTLQTRQEAISTQDKHKTRQEKLLPICCNRLAVFFLSQPILTDRQAGKQTDRQDKIAQDKTRQDKDRTR